MISFYPGPSQVSEETAEFMTDALHSGILGMNHRSAEFMKLMEKTRSILFKKLDIPGNYEMVFTSSATECWEIITQSLSPGLSYHLYNGAFGKKWFEYTRRIHSQTLGLQYDLDSPLAPDNLDLSEGSSVICLTQNETSNGTMISNEIIAEFRNSFPDPLIAVDATSSMAGQHLKFEHADVWFASVQKCFGLPSGMAVMILSPRAVEKAYEINERNHYNSLAFMIDNFRANQTPYTPNILAIYLLFRTLKKRPSIQKVDNRIHKRMEQLEKSISKLDMLEYLVNNPKVRSSTVCALSGKPSDISRLKKNALANGLLLGNGYGQWKDTSLRIANFPAINREHWKKLRDFLKSA